jgi:hypothetical protein
MNTDLIKTLVIDPVVDVEESYAGREVVYKSGTNKSQYIYTADSYGDNQFIWNNISPPSLNTVLPRSLKVQYVVQARVYCAYADRATLLSFNSVNLAGAPVAPTAAGIQCVLAQNPLAQAASSMELRLNGSSTSVSINDYASIYGHMLDEEDIKMMSSTCPLQKDTDALYAGSVAEITASNFRSPFVPYGANTNIPSRASFVWTQTAAANTGTAAGDWAYANYSIQVTEELYISPLCWGKLVEEVAGISNLNNLILNCRFDNVQRMVRCVAANGGSIALPTSNVLQVSTQSIPAVAGTTGPIPVAGPAPDTSTNPQLNLVYITQDPILAAKMPSTISYDYSLIQPFITSQVNFGQTQIQSIRLPSIPKKLYVFARPSKQFVSSASTAANTVPDTFLRITNVSISFNNRISLLNADSEYTLYTKSVANGLKDTWEDWRYNTGSLLIIDVERDLGLEADETTGQSNKYSTLQIQVTFSNSPQLYVGSTQVVAANWAAYVLVESPGKMFITASEAQYILTGPSSAEVLALTSNLDNVTDHSHIDNMKVGGSFSGRFGKLLKSGASMLSKVKPEHLSTAANLIGTAANLFGAGVAGGAVAGGAMRRHKRVY